MSRVSIVTLFRRPDYLLASGFGSGLFPFAPGTAGSALALLLALPAMRHLQLETHLVIIAVGFVVGVWCCDKLAKRLGSKDPSIIVWDEFIGQWISLLLLPPVWYWLLAAFLLFRLFDILKPWPAIWADKSLSGGLGIMLDDVFAGIYTLLVLQGVMFLLPANLLN